MIDPTETFDEKKDEKVVVYIHAIYYLVFTIYYTTMLSTIKEIIQIRNPRIVVGRREPSSNISINDGVRRILMKTDYENKAHKASS